MNKQELRDALASRGLDTNGLRPSLIQRLEISSKASAAASADALSTAACAGETLESPNETLALTSQETLIPKVTLSPTSRKGSLARKLKGETLTLNIQKETLTLNSQEDVLKEETLSLDTQKENPTPHSQEDVLTEETVALNTQKETPTLNSQEDVLEKKENSEFKVPRESETVSRADIANATPDANLKASALKWHATGTKGASLSVVENGKSGPNGVNGCTTGSLSDLDKKRRRAERFGMGLQVSEKEKLALRAERFAGAQVEKKASSVKEPESEKRKQRAARFGIVDEAARKKARQERFAPITK